MRWKVLTAEIVAISLVAAAGWHYFHRPFGPAGSMNVALQESREANDHPESYRPVTVPPPPEVTEPTIAQPPKATVGKTPIRRKTTKRRTGHRTMLPAGDGVGPSRTVPDYIRHPGAPMDIRPPAVRRAHHAAIPCSQVPAIVRQFDRNTIISAAQARGLDDDQTKQVLACLGK